MGSTQLLMGPKFHLLPVEDRKKAVPGWTCSLPKPRFTYCITELLSQQWHHGINFILIYSNLSSCPEPQEHGHSAMYPSCCLPHPLHSPGGFQAVVQYLFHSQMQLFLKQVVFFSLPFCFPTQDLELLWLPLLLQY